VFWPRRSFFNDKFLSLKVLNSLFPTLFPTFYIIIRVFTGKSREKVSAVNLLLIRATEGDMLDGWGFWGKCGPRSHNPKVSGSNPDPATREDSRA